MFKRLPLLGLVAILCSPHQASAHYLWVTIDNQSGEHGVTRIFFEESPSAGDGHYLDHFSGTSKTWFRSVEQIEPELLETSDINRGDERWLEAKLPAGVPRSIDCYGKFGVYKYGQTNVLLHYYARNLGVSTHEDLHELGRAEHMDLDIVLFALLFGVRPLAVHEWYLAVYVDAVEWAELPNTLGMSQFADGGIMASKPYVATGKYIQRMSNYCADCRYDPAKACGEDACPFTTLYWDFLQRHRGQLEKNQRMVMQVRNLDRKPAAELAEIRRRATAVRSQLS